LIYDVIVVGAGPSGATAARECAELGLSVLMIDKEEFPRDKPCGGGVTLRAANLLPFDLSPVVERATSGVHLSIKQTHGVTRLAPHDIVYMTQRRHLDQFLAEKAVRSGVVFKEKTSLQHIERQATQISVHTANEIFRGRTLVGADGANGKTARLTGIKLDIKQQVALEGNVSLPEGIPTQWEHVMGLDIGSIRGGYGWLFPKQDHLNVGIGGWQYDGPSLKKRLRSLATYYGFDPSAMWGVRGHHLPVRNPHSPLASGNVLLVGDAAGLIDPMTDEGIHSSFWSGKMAAKHIERYIAGHTPNLDAYQDQLELELGFELDISRKLQDIFHLMPGFFMRIEAKSELFWHLICRIMRGEQTYAGVMRNHTSLATIVDFISDTVRVAPPLQRMAGLRDPAPPERFFVRSRRQSEATEA